MENSIIVPVPGGPEMVKTALGNVGDILTRETALAILEGEQPPAVVIVFHYDEAEGRWLASCAMGEEFALYAQQMFESAEIPLAFAISLEMVEAAIGLLADNWTAHR